MKIVDTDRKDLVDSRYWLRKELGEGGMGKVYKAYDTLKSKIVALKITTQQGQTFVDRFKREADICMNLKHENIAKGYSLSNVGRMLYFTMEYVDGVPLHDYIMDRFGFLSFQKSIDITLKILDAIIYAHGEEIIHRDIKPSNIIIDYRNNDSPKIIDFGLGKNLGDTQSERLTLSGLVIGSRDYMPPEQIGTSNENPMGKSADIYSIGVVLHEMLTGYPPFSGTQMEVIRQKLYDNPNINRKIPPAIKEIVSKSTEKDPENRYKSAKAFRNALVQVQESMGIETISSNVHNLEKRRRKERKELRQSSMSKSAQKSQIFAIISYFLVVVLGIALFAQVQHYEAIIEKDRKEARQSAEKAKKKLKQAKKKAKQDIVEIKQKLKDARNKYSTDLSARDKKITRLKAIFENNKRINVPKEFKFLGANTYTCGGVTNTVREYIHKPTGIHFVLLLGGILCPFGKRAWIRI